MQCIDSSLISGLAALVSGDDIGGPSVVLAFIAVVALLMVTWVVLAERAARRRTGRFQEIADLNARRFVPKDDGSLLECLEGLPLFSKGRAKRISNVLHGERTAYYGRDLRDGELATFDYRYRTGSGKTTHNWEQRVFYLRSPVLSLPPFEVRPRGWPRVKRGIPVGRHPEFSASYLLVGDDETAVRAVLSDGLLAFLATQVKLNVEADGDQLVVYRRGKRLKPDQVEQFEQIGLQIFAVLPHSTEA